MTNRGTGAGGKKTTFNGKKFEQKTDHTNLLLEKGYKITSSKCLVKKLDDRVITFATQNNFKKFIQIMHGITINFIPDEAYHIAYTNGKIVIKIIEKKAQAVSGSVDVKLWAGIGIKRDYEITFKDPKFKVEYAFCVSDYLKQKAYSTCNKKWANLRDIILPEQNIPLLYGDDKDYFSKLNNWLYIKLVFI